MSTSADATSEALAGSLRTRVGPFEHETRRAYSREPIPSRDLRFSASARWRLASERRRRIIRVKRRLARGRFFHPSHDGEGLPAEEEGGHGARYRPRTSRELEPRASRPRSYRLWSLASRARRGVEISFADPLPPSVPPTFLPRPSSPPPSAAVGREGDGGPDRVHSGRAPQRGVPAVRVGVRKGARSVVAARARDAVDARSATRRSRSFSPSACRSIAAGAVSYRGRIREEMTVAGIHDARSRRRLPCAAVSFGRYGRIHNRARHHSVVPPSLSSSSVASCRLLFFDRCVRRARDDRPS